MPTHRCPPLVASVTLLAILLAVGWGAAESAPPYAAEEGDIVFQSLPHAPLVDAIEGVTQSPWSHCGIVVRDGDDWAVLEAVGPVMVTSFKSWVKHSRDGRFAAYRLKDRPENLVARMIAAARSFLGRPYDIHYRMDDEAIYCSELVQKAFMQATGRPLGRARRLGDMNWQPFEAFIREIEGGALPLDREIISPQALTESPEVAKVY